MRTLKALFWCFIVAFILAGNVPGLIAAFFVFIRKWIFPVLGIGLLFYLFTSKKKEKTST